MKLKQFICIIFVPWYFQNDSFSQENKVVISLGIRCLPAIQIKKYGLQSGSYPFDWNSTDFDGLMLVLQNDFNDFLAIENIKYETTQILSMNGGLITGKWVRESKYNICLMHDFSFPEDLLKEYEDVKQKYSRRIARLYDALSSGKHIYFIRHLITKAQAIKLTELLDEKFPFLNYTLIAIDYTQEIKEDWQIPKVKNFYFQNPTDDWATQVNDTEKNWEKVFEFIGVSGCNSVLKINMDSLVPWT